MAEIDEGRLDRFEEKCRETEHNMAVFVESKLSKLRESAQTHALNMHENKENDNAIQQELNKIQLNNKKTSKVTEERNKKMDGLNSEISELSKVKSEFQLKSDALEARCAALRKEKQNIVQELDQLGSRADEKKDQMVAGLEFYEQWLGLKFSRVDEHVLKISFDGIDSTSPDRLFSFTVFVDPNDVYQVNYCEPRLSDLKSLVAILNKSNDFGKFVRMMRQKFVDSVKEESS